MYAILKGEKSNFRATKLEIFRKSVITLTTAKEIKQIFVKTLTGKTITHEVETVCDNKLCRTLCRSKDEVW